MTVASPVEAERGALFALSIYAAESLKNRPGSTQPGDELYAVPMKVRKRSPVA